MTLSPSDNDNILEGDFLITRRRGSTGIKNRPISAQDRENIRNADIALSDNRSRSGIAGHCLAIGDILGYEPIAFRSLLATRKQHQHVIGEFQIRLLDGYESSDSGRLQRTCSRPDYCIGSTRRNGVIAGRVLVRISRRSLTDFVSRSRDS
ncbi:hypothetical protein LSH36_799g01012 [Paralvinella palmiformis]|uniref:Uncharacterized protein n=1 Tax=Paralvinella palmiformis TaxID=53620 RepID=A0AAD9MSA5_9ANNE|nr:hypothetical protein LSH36_799g01012 [Paralvinella palmiformis]